MNKVNESYRHRGHKGLVYGLAGGGGQVRRLGWHGAELGRIYRSWLVTLRLKHSALPPDSTTVRQKSFVSCAVISASRRWRRGLIGHFSKVDACIIWRSNKRARSAVLRFRSSFRGHRRRVSLIFRERFTELAERSFL